MQKINGIKVLIVVALLIATLVTAVEAEPPQPKPLLAESPGAGLYIRLKAGAFDPLQTTPDVPQPLAYTPAEAAEAGVYIVQFEGPVMPAWKQAVVEAGGQLGHYLPDYAFLAKLDAAGLERVKELAFVRWVGAYQPAYKLSPDVDYEDARSYRVILAPWAKAGATQVALNDLTSQARGYQGGFSAVLSGEQLDQAARLADVVWIEPVYMQRLHNDVGGGTIMGGSTAWSSGYTGNGVTICVADTGLDTGTPGSIHQDFSGRVANIRSWPVLYANYGGGCEITNAGADDGADDVDSGHGSHVTGSVAGSGAASGGQFKGVAYEASITMQAVEQLTTLTSQCGTTQAYLLSGIPDDPGDLLQEAYGWGARIHNNSWGGGEFGVYDQQAVYFDAFIHDYPDMVVLAAAGNDGWDEDSDGYVDENSVSSPASAKNLITVGASENERPNDPNEGYTSYTWDVGFMCGPYPGVNCFPASPTGSDRISSDREHLAAFSSRGPMADGRIKPDVVAPGTDILSVRSSLISGNGWGPYDTYYMYNGGTSMASPLTAGAAAVVRDYYVDGEGHANPSAALIKATLINSAVDMSGYGTLGEEAGQPIPNNHEGWGRVDVGAATTPGSREFVDEGTGLNTGATQTYNYGVAAGQPFKVSLVWSDYPGAAEANPALVNDLNLRLTAPDGSTQYWGNAFSGGWSQTGGSADSVNNVENVYVQSPAAGTWTVEVIGQNVPQGPQAYALVVDGNLSLEVNVTGIQPIYAANNGTLADAVVSGDGFEATSQVALVMGSEVVSGTNLVVDTGAGTVTADFDLNGATPGSWDVRAVNASDSDTLADAFTVIDASLPNLAVSTSAEADSIEPGSWLTYTIAIENAGFVSATTVIFTDTLPADTNFESLSPGCEGGVVSLADGFACQVQGGDLTAGQDIVYTLIVSVSASAEGNLTNQVVVGSAEQEGYAADNSDQEVVRVGGPTTLYMPVVIKGYPPLPPGAPTLNAISDPEGDGNYTVSWSASSGATSYTLQEAANASFSSPTTAYSGANTSTSITGKAQGTYYYRVSATNSVGTSGWSNVRSVTVAPSSNPLQNGNFENGSDGSWTEFSTHGWDLIINSDFPGTVTPRSGSWAVWLGGDYSDISYIAQDVTIPSGGSTLSFWHWIASEDACGYDFGGVMINGSTVVDQFNLCSDNDTGGWVRRTVNLSAYVGQTVNVQIRAETDGSLNSNLFIDDVALGSSLLNFEEPEQMPLDPAAAAPRR